MYRGTPSPIFDVPEIPTLRRVKPLPKRRRTTTDLNHHHHHHEDTLSLSSPALQPLEVLGPNATAEELLAHADTLSARMALQSYYMPILGGVQNFLAGDADNGPLSDLDSLEFGVHFAAAAAAAAAAGVAMGGSMGMGMAMRGGRDDDGRGDPDYVDHLQQHGNTKKRKVPANAGGSPRGGHGGDGGRPGSPSSLFPDDEPNGGDYDSSTPPVLYPPPPFPGQLSIVIQKRGKLTAATLAGLQHKEMLKSRKRQLAAVMGALSHGDTLALDQALSASYPLIGGLTGGVGGGGGEALRVHKSKRKSIRLARVMKLTRIPRHPDAAPFPACDFGFVCASATADRLIATKEEVAMLRHQFEVELERQATKAAKMAVAAAGGGKLMKAGGGRAKREKAERERERVHQKGSQPRAKISTGGDQSGEISEPVDGGKGDAGENGGFVSGKAKSGKKKKRSALANASNPHHLRNYVPSRLPPTEGAGVQGPNGNTTWPLPMQFLSAEIPARRKKTAAVPLTHPSEEWICAFCEYDLFYGEDAGYRRAVRSRKKILKRRRRARERAAAAASGVTPKAVPAASGLDEYDDSVLEEIGSAPAKTKWKGDPQKVV
ncbi:hypothetical protein BYT27DRAFT_7085525 [Phlegmacium glaucopus]|nr:hypothetical protein BYT27DRAFT_7085525 [Phlegmacium glaucopus]